MMSKVLAAIVVAALLFGSVSVALGDSFVGEAKNNARLRAGGSMVHHTVAKLTQGTKVKVVKQLGDWYVVRIPKDIPIYISAKWVRMEAENSGVVAGDRVNLRATPDTKYGALGVTHRGTAVKILGKVNGWLKIVPPNTAVGWVYKAQVKYLGPLSKYPNVDGPAYKALQKQEEAKRVEKYNVQRLGVQMETAMEAVLDDDLDKAEGLLNLVLKAGQGSPYFAKAVHWMDKVKQRKAAKQEKALADQRKERKRQALDQKYHREVKKIYEEGLEQIRPKKPVYTAVGTLKGMGLMVLRRGTHKLVDENGIEMYTLRAAEKSGVDLYHWKYFEKEVGIVGTVLTVAGWPKKVIVVKRIDILQKTSK
ncbi:MAG: SH3 domain-containing protein [Planctomycetota bacterium]|jgi:uncharacterized protein YgiM (DUF1202 family)